MARICQVTGKRPRSGNNVSHSNRKTKRRFIPNIQKKKIYNPETGEFEKLQLSAKGLKTLIKRMK